MKIVVDKDIPFIKGVFEPHATVVYLSGKEITDSAIVDADALVVRTRTKCNGSLLSGSKVQFIATATIGTDHIDLDYCRNAGITVTNAAGCNACGVMQYVFTALYCVAQKKGLLLPDSNCNFSEDNSSMDRLSGRKNVLGVIGVGNVGSKVAGLGEYLGFEVLRCDTACEDFYPMDYVLQNADIVTLHTDLNPTSREMADAAFFEKMKDGAIFINSSRGEVVHEAALLENIDKFSATIIDVWNGEPQINLQLLERADIATPHIAGYSYEGKVNGTAMSVKALAEHFGIEGLKDFSIVPEEKNNNCFCKVGKSQMEISEYFTNIFPIFEHCADLKTNPQNFEQLRSNFKYRREFYVI